MTEAKPDQITLGRISNNLTLEEFTLRNINENGGTDAEENLG